MRPLCSVVLSENCPYGSVHGFMPLPVVPEFALLCIMAPSHYEESVCLFRRCPVCWWRAWRTHELITHLSSGCVLPVPPARSSAQCS